MANNTVPASVSTIDLTTDYDWNGFLGLTEQVGPNGDTAEFTYYSNARPATTISPHGAVTTYTYNDTPSPDVPRVKATTNGRWTETYTDGFGRTVKVRTGHGSTEESIVETVYGCQGCSAMGKVEKISQPYKTGDTVYWTQYRYDALGRTVSIEHAGNSGETTYVYEGNTVKVTDPAGKWKKHEMDVFGNLVKVTEPRPGTANETDDTEYSYNLRDQLTRVEMPRNGTTQVRTWDYDPATGRLESVTNPESGQVDFTYNDDGTVATKVDANNTRTEYTYDDYKRVTSLRYFDHSTGTEYTDEREDFTYGTTIGSYGRLKWIDYSNGGGDFRETFTYSISGLVTSQSLSITRDSVTQVLTGNHTYDSEGRMLTAEYPNGELYTYDLDEMGRPEGMSDDQSVEWVKNVTYDPGGRRTYMEYLREPGDTYYHKQTRQFNVLGQMTYLKITRPGPDPEWWYNYPAAANNGRITSMTDSRVNETVTYQYDELNRLVSAESNLPDWGQAFTYDGFGNMTDVTVTKGSAPAMSINVSASSNRMWGTNVEYDDNGNLTKMPFGASYAEMEYTPDNRLKYFDPGAWWNRDETYGYSALGQRVWKRTRDPEVSEKYFYYGIDGTLLAEYERVGTSGLTLSLVSRKLYFAGQLIRDGDQSVMVDRLGTVVARGDSYWSHYPYGDPLRYSSDDNQEKFATYYRDEFTQLDYAQQRYYGKQFGRFTRPDPFGGSANPANPQSWNRYSYVENDPVNFNDPSGLDGGSFNWQWPTEPLIDMIWWFPYRSVSSGVGGGGGGVALLFFQLGLQNRAEAVLDAARDFVEGLKIEGECKEALAKLDVKPEQMKEKAKNAEFFDGTTSDEKKYNLYRGAARSYLKRTKPKYTVADEFSDEPGTTFMAEVGGDRVFYRPSYAATLAVRYAAASLMHEFVHSITGHVDSTIQEKLGIRVTPVSSNITTEIASKCIF